MALHVQVRADLCCGFGNCVQVCPEVFAIDDRAMRSRVVVPQPPAALQARVEHAAADCPTQAILLVADEVTADR